MSKPEPRNPFYILLLVASLLFVVTALAWAIVPTIEDNARAAGAPLPASAARDYLRHHGGAWLLYEVTAMIILGLLSMGLDRLRRLQNERTQGTISPAEDKPAAT